HLLTRAGSFAFWPPATASAARQRSALVREVPAGHDHTGLTLTSTVFFFPITVVLSPFRQSSTDWVIDFVSPGPAESAKHTFMTTVIPEALVVGISSGGPQLPLPSPNPFPVNPPRPAPPIRIPPGLP